MKSRVILGRLGGEYVVEGMAVFPACHLLGRRLRRYSLKAVDGEIPWLANYSNLQRALLGERATSMTGESWSADAAGMPIRQRLGT